MTHDPDNLFERLVLTKLDLHDAKIEKLLVAVAMLQVKSGMWGLLGGLVPVCMALAWMLLK